MTNRTPGGGSSLAPLATDAGLPPGFARMPATARWRAIVEARDPGRIVRSLRADEVYRLLSSVGMDDAHDLLAYTTPDQRRAICDIDAWSGCRFKPERLDRMVEAAVATSSDFATRLIKDLGPGVAALYVFSRCRVSPVVDEENEPGDATLLTPDGQFQVTCDEPAHMPAVGRAIDLLYSLGVETAYHVLQAGRRDTLADLEESAFRVRDARLQDLGFPGWEDRFGVFEPFDVAALEARIAAGGAAPGPTEEEGRPLGIALLRSAPRSFFWDVLAAAGDRLDTGALVGRMLLLVNRVQGALTGDLWEDATHRDAAMNVLSTVSIGLERLSGGDPRRGVGVLAAAWPIEVYRTGLEMLRPTHLHARRILAELRAPAALALFDETTAETLRAALVFPPVLWEALVNPGARSRREFRTLEEAEAAHRCASAAWAVLTFAIDFLGFRPHPSAPRIRHGFAAVFATAWAHLVTSGDVSAAPLDAAAIQGLRAAAFLKGHIRPAMRRRAATLARRAPDPAHREAVAAFVDAALDAVEEALGGLNPAKPVDLRFVGDCLLLDV